MIYILRLISIQFFNSALVLLYLIRTSADVHDIETCTEVPQDGQPPRHLRGKQRGNRQPQWRLLVKASERYLPRWNRFGMFRPTKEPYLTGLGSSAWGDSRPLPPPSTFPWSKCVQITYYNA